MKTLIKKLTSAALGFTILVLTHSPLKAQIGESLNFDGSNDYIQRTETNFSTNDFTIELWLKPTSFANQGYLVTNRTSEFAGSGYWYMLGIQQSSGLVEFVGGAGAFAGGWGITSAVSLTTGVWQHIAAVRRGMEYSLYINGVLQATGIDAYGVQDLTSQSGNNTTYFGAWGPPVSQRYFNGNMDEVRIWSAARTQCEIQTYMNAEIPTTAASLSANYHFNQGTASSVNTSVTSLATSAGSSNGALTNFALTGSGSNWVTPGAVAAGYSVSAAPTASIRVYGNSASLTQGSSATSTLNFTNFGTSATRTFVIQNNSTGTLNVYPPYFNGPNASEFTLAVPPSLTLASSATTSFVVAFTSTVSGFRTTTLNVRSNDCALSTFSCAIGGTATAAALDFDGNDNKVIIPTGINVNSQSFSVEFWSKRTSTLTGYVVGQGNSVSNNQSLHIGFRPGNVFTFAFYGNDINYTTTATSDGTYHHWACVYDASITGAKNRFVYLDGVLLTSDNSPSAYLNTGATIIGDAGYYPGFPNPLVGTVDEVRIWGVARSQCEVQQYMRCEITTTASGLLANYHFNQGTPAGSNPTVITCFDATGNHNGVLTNFNLSGTTSNWVIPGGVISGSNTPAVMTHTLNVKGNGNLIPAGSTTPLLSNFTDFGSALTRTLVVQNIGTGTLYLNGGVFSGANAANFSVTTIPSTLLTSGVSSTLVITLTPTIAGTYSAVLSIYSSDCTNPTYSFVVSASVSPAAALNFDGNNDLVSIPMPVPVTNATNEMWFKTTDTNSGLFVLTNASTMFGVSAWDRSIFLSGGDLHAYIWTSGPSETITTSGTNFADGNWHHVAHVIDVSGQKLYVDGLLRASGSFTASGFSNTHVFLGDAIYTPSGYFNGSIDEVRVWSVARSQCEIQTYMNCEIPTTASGLIGNFHFNQGIPSGPNTSVATLTNATGGSSGSLSGFALTTGSVSNWISPGSVVSGYTTISIPQATLNVLGNSNAIPNNSMTPSTTNGTDFGTTTSTTLSLNNSGISNLYVNGIVFSGANASNFSVTTSPSGTISAGGISNFVISFTPTAAGSQSAMVKVYSNDCSFPTYSFAITASTTPASALSFDGFDDYVALPSLNLNGAFTVEFLTKRSANGSSSYVLGQGSGANINGVLHIGFVTDTQFRFGFFANDLDYATPAASDGNYHHWACVYNPAAIGTNRLLYLDGILVASDISAGTYTGTGTVWVGMGNGNFMYNGNIDELRIWNSARTQCEIQTYKDCEIPTTATNLVANYHFNQGLPSGSNAALTTLTDASSGITGTLNNFLLSGSTSNWVTPGGVVSGYTVPTAPTASISLSGNTNNIPNNLSSAFTSTLNYTAFSGPSTATYVVTNSNTGTLNIGVPYLSGTNASEFSITVLPTATLSASASTSFVVVFTPTAGGLRTASINIYNNDCNIPIFNFALTGTVPVGAALSFDGSADYINLSSNNLPSGNNDFTVEFWVKLKSVQTSHRWIAWIGSAGVSGSLVTFGFDGSNGNKIRIHHAGPDLMASTAAIPQNAWTHVAINYRGASYSNDIFINGTYVETLNFGTPLNLPVGGSFQIGTFDGITYTYTPNMDLDELRIWNRALCQTEIQNNMNCEIATTASSLVANYHFNQGFSGVDNTTITTLTDASGSANTGTLVNFASTGTVSNWTAPGAVTSGSSCSVYLNPEINITGNAINIPSGASTPTVSNFTDLGTLCSNTLTVRSFSIQNTGTGVLSLTSFSMSGPDAALFSIGALNPVTPIAAGGSASFNVTLTPLGSGIKTATLNIASNDCDEAAYTFVVSGTSNTLPIVSASTSHSAICNTASTSVSGSGADTYTWTGTVPAANGISFNPSVTATYSVTGTNTLTGCTSTNSAFVMVTVNALPTVSISVPSNSVCPGNSATLIASGGDTYTWTPGPLNGVTVNPIPVNTTTYSLVGTNTLTGCTSTNSAVQTISITAPPTVSISVPVASICAGSQATLIAIGASSYSWSPGPLTTGTINPQPTSTTIYSLTGISAAGCASSNTATLTLTVNALPTVSISTTASAICAGESLTLSASGAISYTWSPGSATTSSIGISPANTGTYSLIGMDASGCTSTNAPIQTITVNALPTVTAGTSNSLICNTATTALIGLGADTYTWNPSAVNGSSISPVSTTNYTLSGTNTLTGCSSTNLAVQTISVITSPTVSVGSSTTTVCAGGTVNLSGTNADTYTWNPGALSGANVTVTPTSSTIYTLTGSSTAGCISVNAPTIQITVNALPVVTASASSVSVCPGNTTALFGQGASTYTWSSGINDGVSFTPTSSDTYTVFGTDANACKNSATIMVAVNALPTLSVSTTKSVACEAESIVLTALGANTYSWSAGQVSPTIVITPSVTTTYSVTGVDVNGCKNSAVYIQSVNPCPGTITAVATVTDVNCKGKKDARVVITTTHNYSNAELSYTWNPDSLCPKRDCSYIENLGGGQISVLVKITYTLNNVLVKQDSVLLDSILIKDVNAPCDLRVFTGFSPNGDGKNDIWQIENIQEYPKNKVSVFNRWGVKVFEAEGYNNGSKSWPTADEADKLPTGTYFYIIDLGNGSKTIKGWVELIKG